MPEMHRSIVIDHGDQVVEEWLLLLLTTFLLRTALGGFTTLHFVSFDGHLLGQVQSCDRKVYLFVNLLIKGQIVRLESIKTQNQDWTSLVHFDVLDCLFVRLAPITVPAIQLGKSFGSPKLFETA